MRHSFAIITLAGAVLVSAGCGGGGGGQAISPTNTNATIANLKHISTISSSVDPANGDTNPYAIAFAPTTFTGDGVQSHVQPGDLVVGNFGATGQGTTFQAIRNGTPVRVYSETNAPTAGGGTVSTAGPVALAFAPNGNLWIANLGPTSNGVSGNVQIVKPSGTVAKTFTDPKVIGGWGQAFNGGYGGKAAFFTVNITNGTVARINILPPAVPGGPPSFTIDQITPNLGFTAGNPPVGPQGLVHTADDTLYVADGSTNTIFAIPNSTTTGQTAGHPIYSNGALKQPAGIALNPINGDLIVANQLNNNLVEITTNGTLVATTTVDPAVVNPVTGANAALFGLAAVTDPNGNLNVYYTNDNTNSVNLLAP